MSKTEKGTLWRQRSGDGLYEMDIVGVSSHRLFACTSTVHRARKVGDFPGFLYT